MQELDGNNPINFDGLSLHLILDNPRYQEGFNDGISAYESEYEEKGRLLTGREVCRDINRELDPSPSMRRTMEMAARRYDIAPDPWFTSGFLAGWIHAHLFAVEQPATTHTEPLAAVILPFPNRQA